ncbi:MAG: alpha/beta hydrolase [Planctomycetota bacterium]
MNEPTHVPSSRNEGRFPGRVACRVRRGATVALAAFIAGYVLVVILVGVWQRHLIYFPSRELEGTPGDVGLAYEDVSFTAADGVKLAGWYVPHATATATVLIFHGNAGNVSHRLHKLKVLHGLGYNSLIIDYRGYGRSDGEPSEGGLYLDAQAAWNHLVESRGESPSRIVVLGRSLGGAVAIDLASRRRPAALVVESSFTSLVDVGKFQYPFLPVAWILRDRFESIDKIGRVDCPKLFLHGQSDDLIPLSMAQALFDAASPPKLFVETPGDHNESGFTYAPVYAKALATFITNVLAESGG